MWVKKKNKFWGKQNTNKNWTAWRSTKKTEKVVNKLIEAFKIDATVEQACAYADISRETYYKWIKADKDFSDEIDKAKEFLFLLAKKRLTRELHDPKWDYKAAVEILKRRDRTYKDKVENEVTWRDWAPIEISQVSQEEKTNAVTDLIKKIF